MRSALARVIWKQACDADNAKFDAPNRSRPAFRNRRPRSFIHAPIQRFVYAMDDPLFNDKAGRRQIIRIRIRARRSRFPPVTGFPPGFPASDCSRRSPDTAANVSRTSCRPCLSLDRTPIDPAIRSSSICSAGRRIAALASDRQYWVGQALPQPPNNKVGLIPRRPLYTKIRQPGR